MGDVMVFDYKVVTTYATPNGNVTNYFSTKQTITILAVNPNATIGEIGYSSAITELNGTSQTTPTSAKNFTTIFDPYDNMTYIGNIGFWPVIYTDVRTGSVRNLEVNESYYYPSVNGSVSYSTAQYVNATVSKGAGLISVNMTLLPSQENMSSSVNSTQPVVFRMKYNATTGVLQDYSEYANIVTIIEKIFTYHLVSFTRPAKFDWWFLPYVAVGVVAAIVVVEVLRRKPSSERRKDRVREKFRRSR